MTKSMEIDGQCTAKVEGYCKSSSLTHDPWIVVWSILVSSSDFSRNDGKFKETIKIGHRSACGGMFNYMFDHIRLIKPQREVVLH